MKIPSKPMMPIPPDEFIKTPIEIFPEEGTHRLIDLIKANGYDDVKLEDIEIHTYNTLYGSYSDSNTIIYLGYITRTNPFYEKILAKYEKDLALYNKRLAKYEKDIVKYKQYLDELNIKKMKSLKKELVELEGKYGLVE